MRIQTKQIWSGKSFAAVALAFAFGAMASNGSAADYPPTPGFEKLSLTDTSKFHLTKAFSVFDKSAGYDKNVSLRYVYRDGRYDKVHSYNTDIVVEIYEFATPEKAQAYLKKRIGKTIPEAQANTVKLPPCRNKHKSDSDNFSGPNKLVKKFKHPSGSEVVVLHSGDFNNYDCTRESNRDESVWWTDGVYCFEIEALPYNIHETSYGRAEEFALDYLTALGKPVAP
jgi:hypothetical protein